MYLLELWFSQGICPVVGLLLLVFLFLIFQGTFILFSIVVASIYISTNSVRGFPFLYILSGIVVCRRFYDGHSDWYEVIHHCSFDLQSSSN